MAQAAAILSRPHIKKKAVKHTATPPMSQTVRGKRPRPSDPPDLEKPLKKKDAGQSAPTGMNGGDGSAYRKGMYLAFIDDAFAKRAKGDNGRYNELISQFRTLIPSSASSTNTKNSASTSTSSTPPTTPAQLRVFLDALTHVVSKLDRSHAPLLETVLDLPWAMLEDSFVAAYVRFISALVSARPEWLRPVLDKCVKGFKYRSNYTARSPSAMPTVTRRLIYSRLHNLLRLLISLIPTLSPSLSPLLSYHFPSKREPRPAQICYIDNLLTLSTYCPGLLEDIFTLVIERALNIDVEIQGEPEEWEEVEEEILANKVDNGIKEIKNVKDVVDRLTAEDESSDESDSDDDDESTGGIDLDDIDSDDEPDPLSDDEAARKAKDQGTMTDAAIRKVLENRTKLDAILTVILDHIASAHSVSTNIPLPTSSGTGSKETTPTPDNPELVARRQSLFHTLLDIFDRTLLRTFKTRNVQFLLFYLCSLSPSHSDHFVGVLLHRALFELDAAAVTRVAAAGYIASFISRASFIDAGMTRKVVKHLCAFLQAQVEDNEAGEDVRDLQVFYAVAQAVFYIFCFRWKDLLDEDDDVDDQIVGDSGRRWMLGLETLRKVVGSSFNPLKVCAQPVVNQFAAIAHKTSFLYCYAVLDSNRRNGSNSTSSSRSYPPVSSGAFSGTPMAGRSTASAPRQLLVAEEMDSFFPFDPFKLPAASVYIDGIYRSWVDEEEESGSEVSSSDDEDSDEEESSSDIDSDFDGRRGGLAVPGSRTEEEEDEGEFSRSFDALSLSPDHGLFGGRALQSALMV